MYLFDVILDEIGHFGRAQTLMFFLLSYQAIASGFNALATVFIAFSPEYRCNVPPLDNSTAYPALSEPDILNFTTPIKTNGEYNTCHRYGYNLSLCANESTSCVNMSAPEITCDHGYYFDRSVFTETVITEFDLVCDRRYLTSLSTSMYYLGMLIGSFIFGNMADLYGRKPVMAITYLLLLISMLGLSYATSVEVYMFLRVVTAVFGYGCSISTFVYLMEIVGPEWRTLVGMGNGVMFAVGYMILGGVAYNWRDWHEIMRVCTILACPFLLFAILLPESPRWLFANKENKQGVKVSKLMAQINKVDISEEVWKNSEITEEEIIIPSGENKKKYTSLDLFKYRGTRSITIQIMINWFINSFVFYGISLNAGALGGSIFVNNTLNGLLEIGSYIFCIFFMDKTGRRNLLCAFFLIAGCSLILSIIVKEYAYSSELVTLSTVFAFLAKFGISGSYAVVHNYTSELFATVVRGNGFGMASIAGRIGGILAPLFISLQDYVDWLPNAIFGVLALFAGVLTLNLPDTTGNRMMETVEEAEEFYKTRMVRKHHCSFRGSSDENTNAEYTFGNIDSPVSKFAKDKTPIV